MANTRRLKDNNKDKWKCKVMLSDNVVFLTAHTCVLTEYFICLCDVSIYLEPEVAFNCSVTEQSRAQLSILKEQVCSVRELLKENFFFMVSGKPDV